MLNLNFPYEMRKCNISERENGVIIDFENQIKTFRSIYENIFFWRNRLIWQDELKNPYKYNNHYKKLSNNKEASQYNQQKEQQHIK